LSHLSPEELKRGVVTHSSGNHAGALALAAKIFRTRAYVVMPSSASETKRNAVLEYGGEVITCLPNAVAREATARQVQSDTGAVMIPPFDHPNIIAGQGTVALEMLQQVPHLEYIIAPVGGGGMVSGICIAAKAISPRVRVLAAEPAGADDAFQSKEADRFIPQTNPNTIADGLLTSMGEFTWPIIQKNVHAIITVTEDEIVHWMRVFWERTKLLIEPSSAVAVAAVFSPNFPRLESPKNIGIVLSGGNVNLDSLPWI
jgi:threonine dehydratase/serine racemase